MLLIFCCFVSITLSVCPITSSTNIVYNSDTRHGVGVASNIWISNLLAWWKVTDPSINYLALTAADIQICDLSSYLNLRVFIEPGGNAYNQLAGLKTTGTTNIKNFVNRNQTNPSAYVGFCAGAYVAAYDYLWETYYEGPSYFTGLGTPPPLGLFPHTVEGSFFDIGDDQFGTYDSGSSASGVLYRMVNVSNSQTMLYYGGSVFGGNVVPDYADVTSSSYDANVNVITYYNDFYGFGSKNIPAVWIYKNLLLTSAHPEADDSTCSDCPSTGTIPSSIYLQNRAWLVTYINQVASTTFIVPNVNPIPVFNTAKPHTTYPVLSCYTAGVIFCDSFTIGTGIVYSGMFQWQRNMTTWNAAKPWNTTFTGTMLGTTGFGNGQAGTTDGWAVVIPNTGTTSPPSVLTSKTFSTTGYSSVYLSFYYKGKTLSGGLFVVSYFDGTIWTTLFSSNLYGSNAKTTWTPLTYSLPTGKSALNLQFSCKSGSAVTNYCGIDTVVVSGV
jgi:glutamine amidotransferase-like uncharacterized protein